MNRKDYVRTKDGRIGKIRDIVNENDINYIFTDLELGSLFDEDILKSSPNIIDILEVGDYVNGKLVSYIRDVITSDNIYIGKFLYEKDKSLIAGEEDIKSIVTKEQFKSMEYKVGE